MFFEGSEKKIELVVKPEAQSLRGLGKEFWEEIVKASKAEIISSVHNGSMDAYLLSESSLFVWDNTFLMITCGRTVLVDAVFKFLDSFPKDQIQSFIFQRKNEYLGHLQESSFIEDRKRLSEVLPGVSYRFGHLDLHHNNLYHLAKPFSPSEDDRTVELLMYHIGPGAVSVLTGEGQTVQLVRDFFQLEKVIPGFKLDDFVFEPYGYSLNAIKENRYLTIHVTPQEDSSYISLETNLDLEQGEHKNLVQHFLKVINPQSFDLIRFNLDETLVPEEGYLCIQQNKQKIECGYNVVFSQYIRKLSGVSGATLLEGESDV